MKGPVASKAIVPNCFRDMRPLLAAPLPEATHSVRVCPEMDPEDMAEVDGNRGDNEDDENAPEAVLADYYELTLAPKHLTMDLPIQITI